MSKRRITLSLDEDVVAALESLGGKSVSAAANSALREAVAEEAHHRALLEWIEELNREYGEPTPQELAAADAALDEVDGAIRDVA